MNPLHTAETRKKLPFESFSEQLAELQIETRNLVELPPTQEASLLLRHEWVAKYLVLPLQKEGNRLWLAMCDPLDYNALADLQLLTKCFIEPVLARETDIRYFMNELYGSAQIRTIASQFLVDENIRKGQYKLDASLRAEVQSAPVVQLVDSLIESAFVSRASDIHIEPFEDVLRTRYRIDGQLTNPRQVEGYLHPNIISRLKIMGGMNIAEKRLPQDGHFGLDIRGEQVDFRLSTLPTFYGEKAVIRLLYGRSKRLPIQELGFFAEDLEALTRLFNSPYGAVILTGPTGSGKSTTLSGFLSELNSGKVNIITVEDPVENPLTGVNHVSVDTKIGFDFPRALKHILRQDPDIIMVGEVRDEETAAIAVRAAITGHLVLYTLHTNDAVGVFPRLVDMGVKPYLVAASLNGVIAQRLVRRLCPFCAVQKPCTSTEAKILGLPENAETYVPVGCNQCNKVGYKGRFALYEYIVLNEAMRNAMADCRYEPREVEKIWKKDMKTMLHNGVRNILAGNTSVEEVMRVAFRE